MGLLGEVSPHNWSLVEEGDSSEGVHPFVSSEGCSLCPGLLSAQWCFYTHDTWHIPSVSSPSSRSLSCNCSAVAHLWHMTPCQVWTWMLLRYWDVRAHTEQNRESSNGAFDGYERARCILRVWKWGKKLIELPKSQLKRSMDVYVWVC